jgi:hypothetical protein
MRNKEYLNIVLDIDETLLYFIQKRYRPHSWDTLSAEEKAKYDYTENKNGNVLIRRPNIKAFFEFLFQNCSVSLWTLSDQDYADDVAAMILRMFPGKSYKFASIYCDKTDEESSEYFGGRKNLKYFYEDPKKPHVWPGNTILIDDLPSNSVNKENQHNSITIKPFALFGEVKDRTDPYEDVSQDTVLLDILNLLQTILRNMAPQDSIFSEGNCARLGITHMLKDIQLKSKTGSMKFVRGIGIGSSHLFKSKSKSKKNSKSRKMRKSRKSRK